MTPDQPRQDGSAPVVELALGMPLVLAIIWLVIWAGTGTGASGELDLAAHDAARLASTLRTAADRPAAATGLVDSRLADSACSTWTAEVESTDSVVTVTIGCLLDTPQMAGLQVPTRTVSATGRSTIDRYFLTEDGP